MHGQKTKTNARTRKVCCHSKQKCTSHWLHSKHAVGNASDFLFTDVYHTANESSRNNARRLVQGKKVAIAGKKK